MSKQKYYITSETLKTYETNPSVENLHLRVKSNKVFVKDNEALIITNAKTGETTQAQGGATFVKEELVDQEQFIKLYTSGIEHLAQLTGSGFKVFQLVYRELLGKKDIDTVFLDFNELKHFGKWKWSKVTFSSGINELLNKEILYKAIGANKYFTNVNLFFNGDRINVVKSYKLKNKKSDNEYEVDLLSQLESSSAHNSDPFN